MELISKNTEIYCITDDFSKEYELELNKSTFAFKSFSQQTPKARNRKGRMSDAETIIILVLFPSKRFEISTPNRLLDFEQILLDGRAVCFLFTQWCNALRRERTSNKMPIRK